MSKEKPGNLGANLILRDASDELCDLVGGMAKDGNGKYWLNVRPKKTIIIKTMILFRTQNRSLLLCQINNITAAKIKTV